MESLVLVVLRPVNVLMAEPAIRLMVLACVRKVGEDVVASRDPVWIPQLMGLNAL